MPITDRTIYTLPTLPTMSAANAKTTDPTFGSRIVRATDGSYATDRGLTSGSFTTPSGGAQQGWNADGTKFYMVASPYANMFLASFDRTTMDTARIGDELPFSREPVTFHPTNPNLIYGVGNYANHHTIVKVDVSTLPWVTTVVVDLDTITPGLTSDDYVAGLNVCNGVLACVYGGTQEYAHYCLWYPLSGSPAYKVINTLTLNGMDEFNTKFSMHSSNLDKSGRYMNLVPTGSVVQGRPVAPYRSYFWDTTNDTVTPGRTANGGHDAIGWGYRINADVLSGDWDALQWVWTPDLSDPNANQANVINPVLTPREIYAGEHPSWNNVTGPGTPPPYLSVTFRTYNGPNNVSPVNDTPWRAWDEELLMIDPLTGAVQRCGHHRSLIYPDSGAGPFDFYYTPRGNIDNQGQFAMVTSNWGKTLGTDAYVLNHRQDVYIFELGTTPGTTPTSTTDPRIKKQRHGRHRPYTR